MSLKEQTSLLKSAEKVILFTTCHFDTKIAHSNENRKIMELIQKKGKASFLFMNYLKTSFKGNQYFYKITRRST